MATYTVSTTPYPYDAGGKEIRANVQNLTIPSSLTSAAAAPGSFVQAGTGGYKVMVSTAGGSDGNNAAYWIENLTNVNGQAQDWQYLAASTTGYFAGVPVGGVDFKIGEDAAGGAMPDSAVGQYVKVLSGAVTNSSGNVPYGGANANHLIDSSTLTTSPNTSTGIVWLVKGVANLTAYVAGQPREWIVQIVSGQAQANL